MRDIIGVIQAGGLGTRMRELTGDRIPKPMLEFNGKPVLEWQIEAIRDGGITDIVIVIGHLGTVIRSYFGDGERWGVSLHYIEEGEPIGSAGSLYYLKDYPAEDYLLIFGDIFFNMDLQRLISFHRTTGSQVTLVSHSNTHPYDSDLLVADKDNHVTGILGKNEERTGYYPNLVNSGISVIHEKIVDEISEVCRRDFEKDIVGRYIPQGVVFSYRTSEYIKDMGTPERFLRGQYEQKNGICESRNLLHRQRCVFLDRDGTINEFRGLVSDPEQLVLYTDVSKAIRLLNASGFLVIVITNQPVVARGLCSEEDVRTIDAKMEVLLGEEGAYLDDIVFCPHHPDKGFPEENPVYKVTCDCRKPGIGMIKKMERKYNIDLSNSYMIGDTTVDVKTGDNAGLHTVLLRTGEAGKDGKYDVSPEIEAEDLISAVKQILRQEGMRMDYTKDIRDYLDEERKVLESLDENEISEVMNVLEATRLSGNRVFICGNGGSAATASHFTCDFNKGISYSQTVKYNFECLNDNVPMMMAIANDISYEDIFSEPLKNKMRKEDVLLAISGSGNSKNVIRAVEYAKSIGACTIGLVGYDGGELKKMVDHVIHVRINNMQIVEDVHMTMDHVMMYVLSGMKGC